MPISKKILTKYPKLADPFTAKDNCLLDEELQHLVNEAHFWIGIHSCVLYGLMEGDIDNINIDRCQEILELGKIKNIFPEKNYISPEFKLNK